MIWLRLKLRRAATLIHDALLLGLLFVIMAILFVVFFSELDSREDA